MEKLRLVLLADLPKSSRRERKIAREFEENIFRGGFSKLQAGVYSRIADGRSSADMHKERLARYCPETGFVRLIVLTERHFQSSSVLTSEVNVQEEEIGAQLDIFL